MCDKTPLANLDQGGGLASNDCFIITTSARTIPLDAACFPNVADLGRLEVLSESIGLRLPMYTVEEALSQHSIQALKCPPSSIWTPWFFINAARSARHCLVGSSNSAELLTSVLQRPWCVLELCCIHDDLALTWLLEFAMILSGNTNLTAVFRSAIVLLRSEVELRSVPARTGRYTSQSTLYLTSGISLMEERAKIISVATLGASMQSWNGIWLRALCILSQIVGIRAAHLACFLAGLDGHNQNETSDDTAASKCGLPNLISYHDLFRDLPLDKNNYSSALSSPDRAALLALLSAQKPRDVLVLYINILHNMV